MPSVYLQMLGSKLSDYLSDHHIWMSVHSCPCPTTFSRTQRLCVALLLLLGYACVNAAFVSQMDGQVSGGNLQRSGAGRSESSSIFTLFRPFCLQQLFQSGVVDVSAGSVKTGVLSVFAVLPAAVLLSFLFRLREVEPTGSGVQSVRGKNSKEGYTEGEMFG